MRAGIIRNLIRAKDGAAALEFALVAPAFLVVMIGTFTISMLMVTINSLHFAVEEGARCASAKATVCTSAATTQTYAQNHYYGFASATPTFTYSASGCGNTVSGSVTYVLNLGLYAFNIPLSASACFP